MGNAWFVSPLGDEWTDPANMLGVSAPEGSRPGVAPSPAQVLAALAAFPDYRVSVRRRDRKEKGQAVHIEVLRSDGNYRLEIHLLRVTADDRPAGVFVFDYYRDRDEMVRLLVKLAEDCGPLVLWHDSGGEQSVLVLPGEQAEPSATPDG